MRKAGRMMCIALASVIGGSGVVGAQGVPPSEMIKNRIANFREIGTAFKGINDELKVKEPYMPAIHESATQVQSLGSEIMSWFPPGTGPVEKPEMGIIDTILSWFSSDAAVKDDDQTKALPTVWSRPQEFERAYKRFHAEARKMTEVAQAGNKAAAAAQAKTLGAACKNCHDTFRAEIDE